jgi:ubiquinone/menaquinone biosynthesis C-methylase UbiE
MLRKAFSQCRDLMRWAFLRPSRRLYEKSGNLRTGYWNHRADDIDAQWGRTQADFEAVSGVLNLLRPKRILDIGCGSGRLFPLYLENGIEEIVGQDISDKALSLCRQRWPNPQFSFINLPIEALSYADQHFDLTVSNRVLQHVPPGEISKVASSLARLSRVIYVNEMSESDYSGKFFFMYLHNYTDIFNQMGFEVSQRGFIGNQQWLLFTKK